MARSVEGQAPHKWQGKWRAAITTGYDAKGKQQRKYCYGKTRDQCLKAWNALKRQQQDGTLVTGESMTLKAWFDHWLKVKAKEVSARTIEEYSFILRHIIPKIGKLKLDKISPMNIQRMQLAIADEISARLAVHARGLVHNSLDDALKLGLVSRNAAAAVNPLKYEKNPLTIWTAAEVIRFLEHAKGSSYYALFYTALTSGMRPGELMALHWSDIEGSKIHVQHNISVVKNKPILGPPKTKRGFRIITLPADTVAVLEQHRENQLLNKLDTLLVFPSKTGKFLSHSNLLRAMKDYCKKAEVPRIRMHDLRHTYASMRIANGSDIVQLARDLGHANASFTLDVYAHYFAKFQKREAPSLYELVGLDENVSRFS